MGTPRTLVPAPQDQIETLVGDHLARFNSVLMAAWQAYLDSSGHKKSQLAHVGPAARAMIISDLTRQPARRVFGSLPGVWVDERYGRPWVNLDGGSVQVRFRALTPQLRICLSETERAQRLAYHLGDPLLPDMQPATVLTAGYLLTSDELRIERLALVCHVGAEPIYALPLGDVDGISPAAESISPTQLPLTPLSPPLIRSAQATLRRRLETRSVRETHDG